MIPTWAVILFIVAWFSDVYFDGKRKEKEDKKLNDNFNDIHGQLRDIKNSIK